MYIALSISPHFVSGFFVNKDLKTKNFVFSTPFNEFRNLNKSYWEGVISKSLAVCQVLSSEVKVLISTEEESYLLNSGIINYSSIFEVLPSIKQSIVYIGDNKGYANKIVTPLIFDQVDFYKWFPLAQSINEIENTFYNRQAYGVLNNADPWNKAFEQALFREKLSFIFQNTSIDYLRSTQDIILSGPGINGSGEEKKLVLSFLDAITTFGFWRVYADYKNILTSIQLISQQDSSVAESLNKNIGLSDLAGCLVIPETESALISFPDGTKINVNLSDNSISVIPLNKEDLVTVNYKYGGKDISFKVNGGKFGLIIDNRKRPLLVGSSTQDRSGLIEKWENEIGSKINLDDLNSNKDTKQKDIALPKQNNFLKNK